MAAEAAIPIGIMATESALPAGMHRLIRVSNGGGQADLHRMPIADLSMAGPKYGQSAMSPDMGIRGLELEDSTFVQHCFWLTISQAPHAIRRIASTPPRGSDLDDVPSFLHRFGSRRRSPRSRRDPTDRVGNRLRNRIRRRRNRPSPNPEQNRKGIARRRGLHQRGSINGWRGPTAIPCRMRCK